MRVSAMRNSVRECGWSKPVVAMRQRPRTRRAMLERPTARRATRRADLLSGPHARVRQKVVPKVSPIQPWRRVSVIWAIQADLRRHGRNHAAGSVGVVVRLWWAARGILNRVRLSGPALCSELSRRELHIEAPRVRAVDSRSIPPQSVATMGGNGPGPAFSHREPRSRDIDAMVMIEVLNRVRPGSV